MLEILPGGFEERVDVAGVELAGYIAPPLAPAMTVELAAWEPTVSPVAAGWDTAWQRFHQPVVIGPLWIGPPWEQVPAGMSSVTIRPGMAFGTGAHPTTRLCVELLSEQPRGPVLDLGCGSGVLAVVAAVMGFGPVTAVDTDSVAVDETLENAARNGVQLDVRKEDAQGVAPSSAFVVANLPIDTLRTCLARIRPLRAVVSGFQTPDFPQIEGYRALEHRRLDGWGAALVACDDRLPSD